MREVSGKICLQYLTRHWKKHPARGEEKLFEFLLACTKLSSAQREQYEFFTRLKIPKPMTEKEREVWAKKTVAQIKSRGLGTLQLFMISDLFNEWWNGEWKFVTEDGQWVEKIQKKGERHRRRGLNWKKALLVIEKNREEATARFLKSFGPSSYAQYRRK